MRLLNSALSPRHFNTIGYFLSFISFGMIVASLGPTLTGLMAHTHAQLSSISLLFLAISSGNLIGSLFGGRMYDLIRGNRLMAAVLLLISFLMLLIPLISTLWLLFAVMIILGIAEGVIDVGGNILLIWTYRNNSGPLINGLHFCFGVGAFIAPIIIGWTVLISGDINWAYWIIGLMIAPISLLILSQPSPTAQLAAEVELSQRSDYVFVLMVSLFFFLYVGAELGFGNWIYIYGLNLGLLDATDAAYLTACFWGAFTIGRLISVFLAHFFNPGKILLVDLIGCLIGVGMLLLEPPSTKMLWAGVLITGFAMASIYPSMIALAQRSIKITGQITGLFMVGSSVGYMWLPWLIGRLFESCGPQIMVSIVMIDLILTTLLMLALMLYSYFAFAESSLKKVASSQ